MLKRFWTVAFLLTCSVGGFVQEACSQAELDITWDPEYPVVHQTVTFTAVVVTGDPSWFVRYEWDLDGDGAFDDATGQTVEHAFASAGNKPIRLRALDDRDGQHFVPEEGFDYVVVTNDPPTACFTYDPHFPEVGELVTFQADCSEDTDGVIVSYEWVFDDDSTATGQQVTHVFETPGQRPVQLTVTDDGDQTGETTEWVSVQTTPPVAMFSYTPASPTVYDVITFDASGSYDPDGGNLSYSWAFGDGGSASTRLAEYQYMNGGTYTVYLSVRDDEGESDSYELTVDVEGPAAAFTYSPQNPTTQDPVQFHDQSNDPAGDIMSWSWNFGDGGYSSEQNPLYTFSDSGTFTVRLTITSEGDGGQSATHSATRTIQVQNAPPTADFDFDPDTPKVGQMITFSGVGSGDPDGHIVIYEWDFDDDGVTDITGSPVTYAFSTLGAKSVKLTVTDNEGASSTATRVVPVEASPPTAEFTYTPEDPYTGQTISLDASDSSDSDGNIVLYEWDLDGEGTTDATGLTISHSYPSAGVHPVSLMVTDNDGAVDVVTYGIPVGMGGTGGDNQPPTADFTVTPTEGEEANLHEVIDFAANGSSDPDGSIVSYEWDFDRDGDYDATGLEVSHVFHTGGAHVVTLRVGDNDGAFGFKTRVVAVQFIRPRASFEYEPAEPKVGEAVTFDGSGSEDPDGSIDFYEWDFDDDGRSDATGQMAVHAFARGGSLEVTLKVTDNDGVTDEITKSVRVAINNTPIAAFSYDPEVPEVGEEITFANESTDGDGTIEEFIWQFGDETTSDSENPKHTYDEAGTYDVTLQVVDDEGAEGEVTVNITVSEAQNTRPTADFTHTPTVAGVGQNVQFTDASSDAEGEITGWAWAFGDGATSTQQNPTHAYAAEGIYSVQLTVTDAGGLTRSRTKDIQVSSGGAEIALYGYPNPASSRATIALALPADATDVVLRIYSLVGELVLERQLADRATEYEWDLSTAGGTQQPNGLYLCMATASVGGTTVSSDVFRLLIAR